jgi:hypothetical protein
MMESNNKLTLIIAGAVLFFVLLIFVVVTAVLQQRSNPPSSTPTATESTNGNGSTGFSGGGNTQTQSEQKKPKVPALGAIMMVGEEILYQEDLDRFLNVLPPGIPDREKYARQNMIEESIGLQAGAKAGVITLGNTFYNARNKDYDQRSQRYVAVQEGIRQRIARISGSVVALWFFNNNQAGSAGYEGGKRIAQQKMATLQSKVAKRELTMEHAAAEIKQDTSLEQLDVVWQQNAIFTFENVGPDEPITFDETFNNVIRTLPVGGVTNLALLSVDSNGTKREALYAFAQVSSKKEGSIAEGSFEEWLSVQKKNYDVIEY